MESTPWTVAYSVKPPPVGGGGGGGLMSPSAAGDSSITTRRAAASSVLYGSLLCLVSFWCDLPHFACSTFCRYEAVVGQMLPCINISADVWGKSSIMTGVYQRWCSSTLHIRWGLCDRVCLVLVCWGRYGLGGGGSSLHSGIEFGRSRSCSNNPSFSHTISLSPAFTSA